MAAACPPCLRSGARYPDRSARADARRDRGPATNRVHRSDDGRARPYRRRRPDVSAVVDAVGAAARQTIAPPLLHLRADERAGRRPHLGEPVSLRSAPPDLRECLRRIGASLADDARPEPRHDGVFLRVAAGRAGDRTAVRRRRHSSHSDWTRPSPVPGRLAAARRFAAPAGAGGQRLHARAQRDALLPS